MILPIQDCWYKINFVDETGCLPHTHTVSGEIIQTFENTGNILINGELYRMQKNGLYFIHSLATHLVSPDDLTRYNHSIIRINIPEVEKLCSNLFMSREYNKVFTERGGFFCELSPEDVIRVDSIFLKIHNILQNSDNGLTYAQLTSCFTELIDIALKNDTSDDNSDKISNSKIADIVSFISDNALTRISIDDICKKSHISKYHLCRTFKESLGITISEFIKSRRLSVAKQLLSETELTITQIAHRCCFTDASYFSKTFSGVFGITPTAFRAKYK